MKNILLLLDYYMEQASANGICCRNVVRELVRRGYRVYVGSYRGAAAPKLAVWEGVQVVKTWQMPEQVRHRNRLEKVRDYLKWFSPFYRYPPTQGKERTRDMVAAAQAVIEEHAIDTLICVYYPIETLVAGIQLKERFPQLRLCAYMLDSLSGGLLPRFLPKAFCIGRKLAWEKEIFKAYDKIILMESSRAHHQTYGFPAGVAEKVVFSDIPLMVLPERTVTQAPNRAGRKVSICYVGTMGEGIRTPYAFLRALAFVRGMECSVRFAGIDRCREPVENYGGGHVNIRHLGLVSHEEARRMIETADVLLNLGNENTALVPSKIFEYMSFGKPIISTYSHDEDSSIAYLKQYPSVCLLDERADDLPEQGRRLEEFFQTAETDIPYDQIRERFYKNTPEWVCNILEERE